MKDETLDDERVERAEETMRKWVNLSDEKFSEQMFDPHGRELELPYHGGVRDEELLREFIEKAEKMDKGDGYQEDEARARLRFLTWPEGGEWVVPEEEIDEILSLKVPTWMNCVKENDLCKWKRVYNKYSIDELCFISETINIKEGYRGSGPNSSVVVDIFRFIKGDDISLDNFFDIISETEQGPEEELLIDRIGKAVRKIDPALSATTLCHLSELHTDGKSCGEKSDGISSPRGIIDIQKEETDSESSIIHEFCHGVFYMLSVTQEPAHPDLTFREEDKDKQVGILKTPETHPNQIKEFFERTGDRWDEVRENTIEQTEDLLDISREEVDDEKWDELVEEIDVEELDKISDKLDIVRDYQTKNFNEFITVALSNWVCNPMELKESQPEVYSIIEEYLSEIHEKEIVEFEKRENRNKVPA